MANICKPALKAAIQNKRKWLIRLHQKVLEAGLAFSDYAVVTHMLPGRKQVPNPISFCKRNVEISYRSLRGQQVREACPWRCGRRIEDEAKAIL